MECIRNNQTSDEIIVNECPKEVEYNPFYIEKICKARDNIEKQKKLFVRCWKSCNIYIYGTSRIGKSYLMDILFLGAYKKNPEDGTWWCGFKEEDVVIFNEFDASFFKWQKLLDLLDHGVHSVQKKGSHINYSPKVQAFTSNIPLEELYYCAKDYPTLQLTNCGSKPNRRYYSSLIGRFDFVIEYKKFREDSQEICRDEYLIIYPDIVEKLNNQNNSSEDESIVIDYEDSVQQDQVPKTQLTNQNFKQYHTRVETDNGFETEYDSDPQIESSTQQNNYQYSEDSNDISEPESELHSDDSDFTRTKKKGKSKEVIIPHDNIDDEIQRIQADYQEYQELNMNGKRNLESEFLVNDLYENYVLDISEDSRLVKKSKNA
ncbi:replication protein [Gigaspora margarita]|uniref:Replication protein n=1 Tax=Gigaspora margarita TaxID=4874 RepID=A0A8H4A996_GIGMA|nr:replication protein [Gigaspora margarita]